MPVGVLVAQNALQQMADAQGVLAGHATDLANGNISGADYVDKVFWSMKSITELLRAAAAADDIDV
jgi:hypothetical protein